MNSCSVWLSQLFSRCKGAHPQSLLSTRCRPGDDQVLTNVGLGLHVLCLTVWAGMVTAPGEFIRKQCFPWMCCVSISYSDNEILPWNRCFLLDWSSLLISAHDQSKWFLFFECIVSMFMRTYFASFIVLTILSCSLSFLFLVEVSWLVNLFSLLCVARSGCSGYEILPGNCCFLLVQNYPRVYSSSFSYFTGRGGGGGLEIFYVFSREECMSALDTFHLGLQFVGWWCRWSR